MRSPAGSHVIQPARIQGEYLCKSGCRTGRCGSCILKINGVERYSCDTRVEGDILTIEPRDNRRIIRDLRVL